MPQKLELETMEDLLRYARKEGLDSLLKIPGFGPLGLDQLKFQLEKHKIMNKAGGLRISINTSSMNRIAEHKKASLHGEARM